MLKRLVGRGVLALILSGVAAIGVRAESDVFPFDEVEITVAPAPDEPFYQPLPAGMQAIAVAVSPAGPDVAIVMENAKGRQSLWGWRIGPSQKPESALNALPGRPVPLSMILMPEGLKLNSLVWHPKANVLFAAGGNNLYRLEPETGKTDVVWTSPKGAIDRLAIGPRPFDPGYRLFFAEKQPDGNRQIASVTEKGEAFYYVTAARKAEAGPNEDEATLPNTEIMQDSVPIGFHPAGNNLVLMNEKGCLFDKGYEIDNWRAAVSLSRIPCGSVASRTPNGVTNLVWIPGKPGIEADSALIAADFAFVSPPLVTIDGRGIVGVTKEKDGSFVLRYLPQDFPLANVVNAWMFLQAPEDMKLFSENRGLFRTLDNTQLYQLYDSESYYCGGFDSRQPTRPYFVTTDIFWEVYGSAFQGLFMTVERERSLPAFRKMLESAVAELAKKAPDSKMNAVFTATLAVLDGNPLDNAEAARIIAAGEHAFSDILEDDVDYAIYAIRGHYAKSEEQGAYFQAVRYLGHMKLEEKDSAILRSLSVETQKLAMAWVNSYLPFIAPPRAPVVWDVEKPLAADMARPHDFERVFPLSWGWDNEIFDSTIHHESRPMVDVSGDEARLLPMGLDLASAVGNTLAGELLAEMGQFSTFPELKGRLDELRVRFAAAEKDEGDSLYERWIRSLAAEWADRKEGPIAGRLWDVKRLQTGLASWATLRHTTILVNDLATAECGEAGFESIIMRPPRGYVEPDPAAFSVIAALFQDTARKVAALWPKDDRMAKGIIERLDESAADARYFGAIAAKEVRGERLTAEEYAAIHYVGRSAEHNFLVFYSLTTEGNGIADPDPIMKIAEVAGGSKTGFLEAAVGRPLEWDQIVPSFGRQDIVKGAIYSYYELISGKPMSDEEWRAQIETTPRPDWVTPFLSKERLSCAPHQ